MNTLSLRKFPKKIFQHMRVAWSRGEGRLKFSLLDYCVTRPVKIYLWLQITIQMDQWPEPNILTLLTFGRALLKFAL